MKPKLLKALVCLILFAPVMMLSGCGPGYSNMGIPMFDTFITSSPPAVNSTSEATFTFSCQIQPDNYPGLVVYRCRLDGGGEFDSGPTLHLTGLSPGVHTLAVAATSQATDRDLTPAEFTWQVSSGPGEGESGAMDASFVAAGASAQVDRLAVQPDGKFLAAGLFTSIGGTTRPGLARFEPSGQLDLTFNPGTGGPHGTITAMAVQPDGKILVAGHFSQWNGNPRRGFARLMPDGSLDTGFGSGTGADYGITSLLLLPDGKVLIAGHFTSVHGQPRMRLARLNADGSLDTAFQADADGSIYSLALQDDGKIVLCGGFSSIGGQTTAQKFARLMPDGSVDPAFTPSIGGEDYHTGLCIQPDGKILMWGLFFSGGDPDSYLRRYLPTGERDALANFNPNGVYGLKAVTVQENGMILIAGWFDTVSGNHPRGGIARLHPHGALESLQSFNTAVGAQSSGGTIEGEINAVALQLDGKILIGGEFETFNGTASPNVARLTNSPATTTLTGGRWEISGAAPAVQHVRFAVNEGTGWQDLGPATRVPGAGWGINTPLPGHGLLRVTGRTASEFANGGLVQQQFPLGSPEDSWREREFPATFDNHAISGALADADHDGISNLMEYASGSDPNNPAMVPSIHTRMEPAGLVVLYQRALEATDVDVVIEKSGDLSTWNAASYTEAEIGRTARARLMQATVAVDPLAPRAFARATVALSSTGPALVVSQPPGTRLANGLSPVSFGSLLPGQSAARTFTIRNRGYEPLHVTAVSVTGDQAADFTVTPPVLPLTLAPSGLAMFEVTFSPQATGARGTTLRIASNDANDAQFEIPLTGTGTVILAPEISMEHPAGTEVASGGTVNFGVFNPGNSGPAREFVIRNTGNAALQVTGLSITGGQAADFILSEIVLPLTVAPGAAESFTIVFEPSAAGPRGTTLHVQSNDGNEAATALTLQGRGNGPPQLQLPASPLLVPATSPAGAVVNFTITVTDADQTVPPTAVAAPASGTPFAMGETTVAVAATDSGGLTATGSFTVLVYPVAAPHTVAASGLTTPGAALPFTWLPESPSVNASGLCSYAAYLSDGNNGLWSGGPGSASALAITGGHAPGMATGVNFWWFPAGPRPLNATGQSAFAAYVIGDGVDITNDSGLWRGAAGSVQLLAREGTAAPGTLPGVLFGDFLANPALNAGGTCLFSATLTGVDVDFTNDSGLWAGTPGALTLLARTGSPAPGGEVFYTLKNPSLSASGQCVFAGTLANNDTGLWVGAPGTVALAARSGTQAPGLPAGVNFYDFFDRWSHPRPVINGQNRIAFTAHLDATLITPESAAGIWTGPAGSFALLARAGSAAPGTPAGTVFVDFGTPLLNSTGRVAFHAGTAAAPGDPVSGDGIWQGTPGSLTKVVRTGDPAPGTGAGTVFAVINGGAPGYATESIAFNDAGEFVFMAQLSGPSVTTENDDTLWHSSATGTLSLLVREGDPFTPVVGDTRTISTLRFAGSSPGGSGDEDGQASGLNDAGQIAFGASFSDGSTGVFLLPRP